MFMFEERLIWNTYIMMVLAFLMLLLGMCDIFIGSFESKDGFSSKRPPITHKLLLCATIFAFLSMLVLSMREACSSKTYVQIDNYISHIALITYFACKCCIWLFSRERAKICLINGESSFGTNNMNGKIIKWSIYPLIISIILLLIDLFSSFFISNHRYH
eukprot:126677_1